MKHLAAGLKPSSFLVAIVAEQKHHDMEIWLCSKASAVPSFVRTHTPGHSHYTLRRQVTKILVIQSEAKIKTT